MGCEDSNVEGGLSVTLTTDADISCSTAGLDDPEAKDYIQHQEAVFTRVEEGMEGCYGAVLAGGPGTGSVTWTGQGIFSARNREVCVDITAEDDLDTWCCQTNSASIMQGNTVSLINCQLKY